MLRILLFLLIFVTSANALTCDYYVTNTQSTCTPSVGNRGTGTSGDPFTNLYYALTQGLPGNAACGKTICLKGGTYQYSHTSSNTSAKGGFPDDSQANRFLNCDDDQTDDPQTYDGSRTVLPLFQQCLLGSEMIITNAPGEDVYLNGAATQWNSGAWSQCADATHCGSVTLTSSLNDFTKTYYTTLSLGDTSDVPDAEVWVGGTSGALGGRLGWWANSDANRVSGTWSNHTTFTNADCAPGQDSVNPIVGRFAAIEPSNGNGTDTTIIARLATSFVTGGNYDPDFYGTAVTSQVGNFGSTSVISANGASNIIVQKNPAGGSITARYGYNAIYVTNKASNVLFDGITVQGCGGRGYGNCIRVSSGNNIHVINSTLSDAGGEVVAFYGGGPGCADNTCSCGNGCSVQTAANYIRSSVVSNGGYGYWDGGAVQSNTGECIKIKSCENCSAVGNTLSHCISRGIVAYTSDFPSNCLDQNGALNGGCSSDGYIIHNNEVKDSGYFAAANGTNYLYQMSYSADGGCIFAATSYPALSTHHSANGEISNNICYGTPAIGALSGNTNGIKVVGADPGLTYITNNTISKTTGYGLHLGELTEGTINLYNNLLDDTGSALGSKTGMQYRTTVTTNFGYNSFSNMTYAVNTSNGSCPGGCTCTSSNITPVNVSCLDSHRITSAPTFVSTTNYRLQTGSPQINAGTTIGLYTDDVDGVTRSGVWDIGADEFVAGTTTTTTTTTTTLGTTTTTLQPSLIYSGATIARNTSRFIDFTKVTRVE